MSTDTYLLYLATLAVFFATPPGPSQILMISNSLRHGVRASLATAAGDLTANALQMTAAAFGLAAILATSQQAVSIVKWAGVAYLVWIGVRTFRARGPERPAAASPSAARRRLFGQGFLTSAANPKAVVFFAALFPQFIDPTQPIAPQLLILGVTYLVVDGSLLVIYGCLSARLLGALKLGGRRLNRLSGSLMVAAAGLLALKDARLEPR